MKVLPLLICYAYEEMNRVTKRHLHIKQGIFVLVRISGTN